MAKQNAKEKVRGRKGQPAVRGDASPVDQLDASDPGDTVQRCFRYQHAYGVILTVQALRGELPYVAIWCEQHEDLLCKRSDGRFDGWQIKTSTPENGPWRLNSDPLVKSLGRFYELVNQWGDSIADLYFASNTKVDEVTPKSSDDGHRGRCPGLFLHHVRSCESAEDIQEPFRGAFDDLLVAFGADAAELFAVLKRVQIVQGPSRHDFDAAVAHDHLARLPQCKHLTANHLTAVKDHLIRRFSEACAMKVTDGARHIRSVDAKGESNPTLIAKQILVESALHGLLEDRIDPLMLTNGRLSLGSERTVPAGTVLRSKARRGELDTEETDLLERLARATEHLLMREAVRRPETFSEMEAALVSSVLFEYRQAFLRAKQEQEPFGELLLIDLQDRCRRLSDNHPQKVWRQSDECLLGVLALLADDCRVWFSRRFHVDEAGEDLELAS